MEIISYVQDNSRSRIFSLPVFPGLNRNKYSSSLTVANCATQLHSFSVQRVKTDFTLKNAFKLTGNAVSLVTSCIHYNLKKLAVISSLIVLFASCAICGTYFYANVKNHTGALKLDTNDTLDIENLNRLMASFALEGSADYDESGLILNTDTLTMPVQSFKQPVSYQTYKVKNGDTISGIAKKFGLRNISTLISVNDIGNVRQLCAGQRLKIPSIDGIVYTIKKGDSINSIISKNNIKFEDLLDVNELTTETLTPGAQLFLPGVGLDSNTLKNAMGDLFRIPIAAKFKWSSPYGYRIDPIAQVRAFHTGTDLACPMGTPILASMSGKVTFTGINRVYGNYVIIDHGNGYQTLYAHMSKIIATKGQWVSQGTRIGLVGSTGYSTGPHLHFTVYKNGKLINPMTVLK